MTSFSRLHALTIRITGPVFRAAWGVAGAAGNFARGLSRFFQIINAYRPKVASVLGKRYPSKQRPHARALRGRV